MDSWTCPLAQRRPSRPLHFQPLAQDLALHLGAAQYSRELVDKPDVDWLSIIHERQPRNRGPKRFRFCLAGLQHDSSDDLLPAGLAQTDDADIVNGRMREQIGFDFVW